MKAFITLFLIGLAGSSSALADEAIFSTGSIQNIHNETDFGGQVSYGTCPCFRWTVKVELLGGEIETREVLISSEALFQYMQSETTYWNNAQLRTFKIGAAEALLKGAHLGIGFNGVQLGRDYDQNYADLLKTGAYILFNIFRTDAARLDLKSGYDFEKLSVNGAPDVSRNIVSQSVAFKWRSKRWSGAIDGMLFFDPPSGRMQSAELGYAASASVQARIVTISDFAVGAGLKASYSHDPFRNIFGLDPNMAVAGLYLEVSYEPLRKKATQ